MGRWILMLMAATCVTLAGGMAMADFSDGLVAYWQFEDNFEDSVGDFDGVQVGRDDIVFDTGVFGQAVVLNGDDQYIEIEGEGQTDDLGFIDTEMSVSVWFRVDAFDTSWQALVAKGESDAWRIHRRGDEQGMAFTGGEPDTPSAPADFNVNDGEIHHLVAISASDGVDPNGLKSIYIDGELATEGQQDPISFNQTGNSVRIGDNPDTSNREWEGMIDDLAMWDRALTEDEVTQIWNNGIGTSIAQLIGIGGGTLLQAGDANQDLEFNQLDLVKVQVAAKYLTGQPATWGEGDWDGAPGGSVGNPPQGDGVFGQTDIIAALTNGFYLTGPYAAINTGGVEGDGQTSIVYNTDTGELGVDAPAGVQLTSINIDSAAAIFTGNPAENLGGSFDNDADNNIFKATFGSSFGSLSFGTVAQAGLSEDFVANDLTVVGSLEGGGGLGDVDLVFIPEPSSLILLGLALAALVGASRRRR